MTRTVIESQTRTTVIGFDEPFCVIGERINPTGRKILNEELERGRIFSRRGGRLHRARFAAGATVLDRESGRASFPTKGLGEDARYRRQQFLRSRSV